jgi:hypothetical protein
MSFRSNGTDIGHQPAATDLTGFQFCFVRFAVGGVVACGAGEQADGVLQNKPPVGTSAVVRISGVSKLKASAAIAAGARLGATAAATGVTAVAGTHQGCGRAIEAATQAGDIIAVNVEASGTIAAGN